MAAITVNLKDRESINFKRCIIDTINYNIIEESFPTGKTVRLYKGDCYIGNLKESFDEVEALVQNAQGNNQEVLAILIELRDIDVKVDDEDVALTRCVGISIPIYENFVQLLLLKKISCE